MYAIRSYYGKHRQFRSPKEAIHQGIGVIYQERQIVPYLSVAENIYMDEMPMNKIGMIDFKKLNADAQRVIDEFSLPIKAYSYNFV